MGDGRRLTSAETYRAAGARTTLPARPAEVARNILARNVIGLELNEGQTWKGHLIVNESPLSMGSIERSAHDGLRMIITDKAQDDRFEATEGDQVIGWQPYRRYRNHIVLMATEVDAQWRDRGVSSAMIAGVLALIRKAEHGVIPRCKITADYILRHPEYRDMVPDQYQGLLRPVSRPPAPAAPDSERLNEAFRIDAFEKGGDD